MLATINSWDQKSVIKLTNFFSHNSSIVNKFLAEYLIYSIPVILIVLWFYSEKAKKVALRGVFAVILAWPILAGILGRLINRQRPFEISGVKELVFHRPDYSFPSDHAAAIFALGFCLWFSGFKKLSGVILIMGLVISFFRVATGIHYPSDILGGAVIGLVAAYLIYLFDKPLDIIYNFILKILKIVRLA